MKALLILTATLIAGCAGRTPRTLPAAAKGAAAFRLRAHQTETLANGMTILWVEDQSLPYLAFQMMVKSGSADDPAGREGLADLTASLLDKGTKARGATRVAADFEQMGGSFNADAATDFTMLAASSLSTTKDELLEQFCDVVLTPTFAPAEFERERKNVRAALTRASDEPEQFVGQVFPELIFGRAHPYGHPAAGNLKSVGAITRADVLAFYKTHFVPGNVVLAVVGQFDDAWRGRVRQAFGGWAGAPAPRHAPPNFPTWKGIESLLIDRGDLSQAQVMIGTKGYRRADPEYMATRAALKILGENFGSRLHEEIRVKRGLTYHIGAFAEPMEAVGPVGISTFTRNDKIGELLTETLRVYREFIAGGVTDAEVDWVKAQISGQFVRMVETAEALSNQLLILNRYGIGEEYLADHQVNVQRLTKAEINRAIQHHLSPDELRILVYAPKAAAEAALKALGPVEVKSYRLF